MLTRKIAIIMTALMIWSSFAQAARVKDLANIAGVRSNQFDRLWLGCRFRWHR